MQQLSLGTLLHGGAYKIESVLGQGSFGITYLAEHVNLGRKVAIKEFFMKELNSRGEDGSITGMTKGSLSYNYARKFQKEAQNLSRLDHPNIVRVTDSFEENGTFYYVMDYIDGVNLNDYVNGNAISESEAISIIKDVADALIYMHEEKHMLHLDLKPGNIMRCNSDGHIFLIDFGLSKHYDTNGAPETSTTIGLGTPGYAPIEQANLAKNGEFRPTIDVYALAATLYKLLTRETPPAASDIVSDDELVVNKLRTNGIADSIIEVVVKAMLPNVKKRVQTIRDFKDMLFAVVTTSKKAEEKNVEESEKTIVIGKENEETELIDSPSKRKKTRKPKNPNIIDSEETEIIGSSSKEDKDCEAKANRGLIFFIVVLVIVAAIVFALNRCLMNHTVTEDNTDGTKSVFVKGIELKLIPVEAGTFMMGRNWRDGDPMSDKAASPMHEVTLGKDYFISETEITRDLWYKVMSDKSVPDSIAQKPAICDWGSLQKFLRKLKELTGLEFRVPTEAEWEYAARGGKKTSNYIYSGSDNIGQVGWSEEDIPNDIRESAEYNKLKNSKKFDDMINYDVIQHKYLKLQDVKKRQPNELLIYDMSGNAEEWCSDLYSEYSSAPVANPYNIDGSSHVVRGGKYDSPARMCTVFSRSTGHGGNAGIRLILYKQ